MTVHSRVLSKENYKIPIYLYIVPESKGKHQFKMFYPYINAKHVRNNMNSYMPKIGQPRRNGQVSRNIQSVKIQSRKTYNLNRLITSSEKDSIIIIIKMSMQTKVQDQTVSLRNSTKHTKNLHKSFSGYSKRYKRRKHSQVHSMNHHPDTKTRQRHYKKRKFQANIFDEHRCKNPQQHISKPNPAVQKKDHTS